MAQVQATLDAGARAKQGYKYTFRDMDASTEDEQIAAHLCLTAYQKYQSHDYASAVKDFGEALKIAPKMPAVYRNWARMEMEAGFYARATEYISKGIDLAPMDVTMWREWGSIEMKAENYDDAVVKIEHALQIAPDDAELLNLMGGIEKRDDSRRYIDLARTYCGSPEERWQVEFLEMYSEPGRRLEMYSGRGRRRALLSRVILVKGYGFLGNDRGSAIFLHYSGVSPPVTVAQFEQLEGQELSFVVIDRDGRPVASRACTRPSTLDDARRV